MMGFLVRAVGTIFSLLLSMFVYYVVWGQYQPDLSTPEAAMWQIFNVAAGVIIYMIIQARAAQMHPPGRAFTWIIDIIFSVLPLFTVGAAVLGAITGTMVLTQYQTIVLWLVAMATMTDLIFFTLFQPETQSGNAPISVLPRR